MTRKRNIRRWSKWPLWSDQGSFCAHSNKVAFPNAATAGYKLDELKARPDIRKQTRVHLLHTYERPFGRGWHVGHDRAQESNSQKDQDPDR